MNELVVQTGDRLRVGKKNQVGSKISHASAKEKQHTDAN